MLGANFGRRAIPKCSCISLTLVSQLWKIPEWVNELTWTDLSVSGPHRNREILGNGQEISIALGHWRVDHFTIQPRVFIGLCLYLIPFPSTRISVTLTWLTCRRGSIEATNGQWVMSLNNNIHRQVSTYWIVLFCLISIEYVILVFSFSFYSSYD